MTLPVALLCLALVGQVVSMSFILPIRETTWTTSGPNLILWTYEADDPKFVNIQLLHNNNESFQPIPNLITAEGIFAPGINITNDMMIFTPSCASGSSSLPTGSGFTLRMFSEMTNGTRTSLGVTGDFNISADNVTACAGGGVLTIPYTSNSTSSRPSSTATASANLSSSSSKGRPGAIAGGVLGGLVVCLLAVVGTIMYNRHRRGARKRLTQQFRMRKGLVLGKPVDSKDAELN